MEIPWWPGNLCHLRIILLQDEQDYILVDVMDQAFTPPFSESLCRCNSPSSNLLRSNMAQSEKLTTMNQGEELMGFSFVYCSELVVSLLFP